MSDVRDLKFGVCDVCLRPMCQCPKPTPIRSFDRYESGGAEGIGTAHIPSALTREQVQEIADHIANGQLEGYINQWLDHDAALRATLAQQAQRVEELEAICLDTYQVVGSLATDAGLFEHENTRKALDNLSQLKLVHATVLPYPCAPISVAQQAQELARVTRQCATLKEVANNQTWHVQDLRQQLTAMTQERDELVKWKGHHDAQVALKRRLHDMNNGLRQQLSVAQAQVKELEEKDKLFACETCYQKSWIACERGDSGAIESSSGGKQTWWKCEHCWLKATLAAREARIAALESATTQQEVKP